LEELDEELLEELDELLDKELLEFEECELLLDDVSEVSLIEDDSDDTETEDGSSHSQQFPL
jgi:hypothetical protein